MKGYNSGTVHGVLLWLTAQTFLLAGREGVLQNRDVKLSRQPCLPADHRDPRSCPHPPPLRPPPSSQAPVLCPSSSQHPPLQPLRRLRIPSFRIHLNRRHRSLLLHLRSQANVEIDETPKLLRTCDAWNDVPTIHTMQVRTKNYLICVKSRVKQQIKYLHRIMSMLTPTCSDAGTLCAQTAQQVQPCRWTPKDMCV